MSRASVRRLRLSASLTSIAISKGSAERRTSASPSANWRTTTGEEVDFVVELSDGSLIAIECKGGSNPTYADTKGLRVFLDEYGDNVRGALLLHGGSETYRAAPRILATPWWRAM